MTSNLLRSGYYGALRDQYNGHTYMATSSCITTANYPVTYIQEGWPYKDSVAEIHALASMEKELAKAKQRIEELELANKKVKVELAPQPVKFWELVELPKSGFNYQEQQAKIIEALKHDHAQGK